MSISKDNLKIIVVIKFRKRKFHTHTTCPSRMLLSFKQEPINHSIFGIHGALILAALWTFRHKTKLTATAFKAYWRYSNSFTQDRTFIILASLPTSLVSWKSALLQFLAHDIYIYTLQMKYDHHKAISSEGIRKKKLLL